MSFFKGLWGGKTNHSRKFLFDEKNPLSPKELGYWSVKWACDAGANTIRDLHNRATIIETTISARPMMAQFFVVSLQVAAYYSYVARLGVANDVLDEMCQGITDGFKTINNQGKPINEMGLAFLEEKFREYAQCLHEELNAPPDDPNTMRLDRGPTAKRVAEDICAQYKVFDHLIENPLENLLLQTDIAVHGIGFFIILKDDLKLTFSP